MCFYYDYSYDNAGNLVSIASEYMYEVGAISVTNLQYTNSAGGDQLTSYGGATITYDAMGNPLKYRGKSFLWDRHRLISMTKGDAQYIFTYDDQNRRQSKQANGVTTDYYYEGDRLIAEVTSSDVLIFLYDGAGLAMGMIYHAYNSTEWKTYWFEKNLHGDIIGIYNNAGQHILLYQYDTWGNLISTSYNVLPETVSERLIAARNPFRFRGYYFDTDLGLYVLPSGYYDPVTHRMINPAGNIDSAQALTGYNMYVYCGNDPVNRVDDSVQPWQTQVIATNIPGNALKRTILPGGPIYSYGAAWAFDINQKTENSNCYSYALYVGFHYGVILGEASGVRLSEPNNVGHMNDVVVSDLQALGFSVRPISGPDAPVYENEWKIAFRMKLTKDYNENSWEYYYDFHFLRQTNTGQWAEQQGFHGALYLWPAGKSPNQPIWYSGDCQYASAILYYAISGPYS